MGEDTQRGDVLIVDDTPANLRVLMALLGQRGFRVRPVLSGEQALRAAQASVPELVLLDVHMPEMDGFEVCRRLRATPETADVPVIFLSADHEVSGKVAAFAAGGVDYITKPFHLEEVVVRVEAQLELRRLRREVAAERAKSDALLYRMLPREVAQTLRQGERYPGQSYEDVTIAVCDIVGFAELTARRQPREVFELLDRLYTEFDRLTKKHELFKVETVGDSYVAVGGLISRRTDDADRVAQLALDMVATVRGFEIDGGPLQIRVGIHEGDVVGGVVGEDLPRFCLFGGAMALAAKIETASLPMKIHLSQTAARRLSSGRFIIQPRGTMSFPGIRPIETAFLRGPKTA